jgi:hypothetical protein
MSCRINENVVVAVSTITEGQVLRLVGDEQVGLAIANTAVNVEGTAGVALSGGTITQSIPMLTNGKCLVKLEQNLTPVAGDTLYVSATEGGSATNVAPALAVIVGICKDASDYSISTPYVVADIQIVPLQIPANNYAIFEASEAFPIGSVVAIGTAGQVARVGTNSAGATGLLGVALRASSGTGALIPVALSGECFVAMAGSLSPNPGNFVWLYSTVGVGTIYPAGNNYPTILGVITNATPYATTQGVWMNLFPNPLYHNIITNDPRITGSSAIVGTRSSASASGGVYDKMGLSADYWCAVDWPLHVRSEYMERARSFLGTNYVYDLFHEFIGSDDPLQQESGKWTGYVNGAYTLNTTSDVGGVVLAGAAQIDGITGRIDVSSGGVFGTAQGVTASGSTGQWYIAFRQQCLASADAAPVVQAGAGLDIGNGTYGVFGGVALNLDPANFITIVAGSNAGTPGTITGPTLDSDWHVWEIFAPGDGDVYWYMDKVLVGSVTAHNNDTGAPMYGAAGASVSAVASEYIDWFLAVGPCSARTVAPLPI